MEMMQKSLLVVFLVLLIGCNSEQSKKQSPVKHDVTQLLNDPDAFSNFSSLYHATEGEWQFNLHSYLVRYDNKFWAMWSSGPVNESDRDQVIHYATSTDGHHWDPPEVITDSPVATDGKPGLVVARGFYELDGKYYDKLDASVLEVVENSSGKSESVESVNVAAPGEMPGMGSGSGDQLKESALLHYRVHGHMDTGQRAIVVVNDSPEPISYIWEFTHKDIRKAQLYSPFEEVRTVKQGDVLEIKGDGLQILVEVGL